MSKQSKNIELLLNFSVLLLTLFRMMSSSPIRTLYDNHPSPLWWNSCRWIKFDRVSVGSLVIPEEELLHNVYNSAKVAKNHAQHVKRYFLENELIDPIVQINQKSKKLAFLPSIPRTSELLFKQITIEEAYSTSYEYIQFFAVALEQILTDQQIYIEHYSKDIVTEFEEINYEMNQLLCNLQRAIHVLNIDQNENVGRTVMSKRYKDIEELSRRKLRDYTILNYYINATDFISKLFHYYKTRSTDHETIDQSF